MGPPGLGWYPNSSHQTDARLDLPDRDTRPDCCPTLLLGHGYGIVPWLVAVVGVTITCFTFIVCIYSTSHHPDNVWNHAM